MSKSGNGVMREHSALFEKMVRRPGSEKYVGRLRDWIEGQGRFDHLELGTPKGQGGRDSGWA